MDVTFRILRYNPEKDSAPHFEEYKIPNPDPTLRVLDVLGMIKEQEALNTQLYTMPAAASTDSAVSVERASIEGMLNEDATKVGQIETMLSDDATRRDKLKADGDNDAFKAAWTATEAKYTEAMTALDAMKKRNSELKTRIANLDKIAAGATGTDSSNTTLPSMNGIDSGRTGKADTGTTVR
jgi:hypothetical protein